MSEILKVENLTKRYDEILAVDNISFDVQKGDLFAFLGVNGAGKSTTINIICSIISKDSGKVFIEGLDLDTHRKEIKKKLGVVFQSSVLDERLTVYDNLRYRLSFYPVDRIQEKESLNNIIKLLELEPIVNRPIKKLSGGQKRRVDIARAISHNPKFLILDEPTTGLDPQTRKTVWSILDKIRTETGMTIFLTTHYLEEAELASDVVVMDKGRIITRGTPNELKNKYSYDYILSYSKQNNTFENLLKKEKIEFSFNNEQNFYVLKIKDTKDAKRLISKYDTYLSDIEIKKGTMDDVFLNITGSKSLNE